MTAVTEPAPEANTTPVEPAEPATPPAQGETEPQETISPEAARKLRSEAKNLRDRAKQAETEAAEAKKRADDLEAAQLSGTEKAQKEADMANQRAQEAEAKAKESEARASDRLLKAEVISQAAKAKFKNPEIAFRALDRDSVEYDEDGEPVNVADLVKTMAESGDFALETGQPGSGSPANPQGGGETPKETYDERRARLLGGGGSGLWSNPDAQGGGVYMPNPPDSGQ